MKLKQYLNEDDSIVFDSYKEAMEWIDKKSKDYTSKRAFQSTDIYKKIYPEIKRLYDIEKANSVKKVKKMMDDAEISFGDKVYWDYLNTLLMQFQFEGIIVNRKGYPYVKLTKGSEYAGRKMVKWHRGWNKL